MSFQITVAQTGDVLNAFCEVRKWGTGAIGTSKLTGYTGLESGGANASDGVLSCTVYYPGGSQILTVTDQGTGLYLSQFTSVAAGVHHFRWATSAPLAEQSDYHTVVLVGETWISRLDAAVTTRLATSGYTAAPTAASNAGAVWDELLSGHTTTGSAGAKLTTSAGVNDPAVTAAAVWNEILSGHTTTNSAGKVLQNLDSPITGIADPLTHTVPGSYGANTAGLAISKLLGVGSASPISVVSPVALGGSITLFVGDDYLAADSRALAWIDTAGVWPVLTGATVDFIVADPAGVSDFTKTATVDVATGSNKKVEVGLTAANVASIYTFFKGGTTSFKVRATLSTGHVVTLVYAPMYFQV